MTAERAACEGALRAFYGHIQNSAALNAALGNRELLQLCATHALGRDEILRNDALWAKRLGNERHGERLLALHVLGRQGMRAASHIERFVAALSDQHYAVLASGRPDRQDHLFREAGETGGERGPSAKRELNAHP